MKGLKPAVVDGEVADGYFVCQEGNIWSRKCGKVRKLNPYICNSGYPRVSLSTNGKPIKYLAHRIVCETIHPFPIPSGITKKDWKITPASVKKLLICTFQVNHIDHDRTNYHPSNLEWVTARENAKKYQNHRKSNV